MDTNEKCPELGQPLDRATSSCDARQGGQGCAKARLEGKAEKQPPLDCLSSEKRKMVDSIRISAILTASYRFGNPAFETVLGDFNCVSPSSRRSNGHFSLDVK
jgi:hypothetical protein